MTSVSHSWVKSTKRACFQKATFILRCQNGNKIIPSIVIFAIFSAIMVIQFDSLNNMFIMVKESMFNSRYNHYEGIDIMDSKELIQLSQPDRNPENINSIKNEIINMSESSQSKDKTSKNPIDIIRNATDNISKDWNLSQIHERSLQNSSNVIHYKLENNVKDVSSLIKFYQAGVPSHYQQHEPGKWLKMQDSNLTLYAYSAIYDGRDTGDGPVIRIIVVSHILDNFKLYCVFDWSENTSNESKAVVEVQTHNIGYGFSHDGNWYREYVIWCKCNPDNLPKTVSLITQNMLKNEAYNKKSVETGYENPQVFSKLVKPFSLPIHVPVIGTTKLDFAVCVSASYNHSDGRQSIEWLELLKLLSVSNVFIYNHTLDKSTTDVLGFYKDFVVLKQTPMFLQNEGEFALHGSPAINDCYYRNMFKYDKIIVIDFDEVIIASNYSTCKDLINYLSNSAPKNSHPLSFTFRNLYYFFELPKETDVPADFITLSHRKHVKVSEPGYSVKSILDTKYCTHVHNHICWRIAPKYQSGKFQVDVEPNIATNKHYKKCHFDSKTCTEMMKESVRDDTMLRYKDELIDAVDKTVKEMKKQGILPGTS